MEREILCEEVIFELFYEILRKCIDVIQLLLLVNYVWGEFLWNGLDGLV